MTRSQGARERNAPESATASRTGSAVKPLQRWARTSSQRTRIDAAALLRFDAARGQVLDLAPVQAAREPELTFHDRAIPKAELLEMDVIALHETEDRSLEVTLRNR